MADPLESGILLAQAPGRRPPRPDHPEPIPEEDENVEPIPGPSCEPLALEKFETARRVFPLLPQELRDQYVALGKQKDRDPAGLLAWDLGAAHDQGGINSRDQRVKVWRPDLRRSIEQTDWEHFTRSEAYRFIAGYREFRGGRFGVPHTPLSAALATFVPPGQDRPIVESIFFPNAPLAGAARRAKLGESYEPATIIGVSDGDTIRVRVNRNGCPTEEGSIRFAGIDTPEKFRSEAKFWPQHEAVMNLWRDEGLLGAGEGSRDDAVGALLANRMEYAGAVSSLIMKDFLSWAVRQGAKFSLEETFNRVRVSGDDPAVCDAVTLYDIYLRSIWVLRVEPPGLIADYMEKRLSELMTNERIAFRPAFEGDSAGPADAKNGAELWRHYQLKGHGDQLAKWRAGGRGRLADLLDPSKLPTPSALYSKAAVQRMVGEYRAFLARHPDRAGDINLAMVAMGAAYTYTKYRNDLTPAYLELGEAVKAAGFGLWGEELVRLMDPNVRYLNKTTRRFEPYAMPRDCL